MTSSDWIAMGSLIIALFALFYTYFSNTKKYELTSSYRSEILKWFEATVEVLIRLKDESEQMQENSDPKKQLLSKLSSLIEVGRFYFPNIDKGDDFGSEKPFAYRGYRTVILDLLVFSYDLFKMQDAHNYLKHAEVLQRYFTSTLYEIIDPKQHLKDTKRYTKKMFTKELMFEEFIENEPDSIFKYL